MRAGEAGRPGVVGRCLVRLRGRRAMMGRGTTVGSEVFLCFLFQRAIFGMPVLFTSAGAEELVVGRMAGVVMRCAKSIGRRPGCEPVSAVRPVIGLCQDWFGRPLSSY